MEKIPYDTPKVMISLFAAEDIMDGSVNGGSGSGSIWDDDTTIHLPPVRLP